LHRAVSPSNPPSITCTLADGTRVSFRTLRPDDRDALHDAFRALSASSRYSRFLRPIGDLDDKTLDYLTKVDGRDHVALVATRESLDLKEERGVAIGRFIRLPDGKNVAEVAVTVADDVQGRGLGTAMLRALAENARRVGLEVFQAEMLAEHRAIPRLLRIGAKIVARDPGVVLVEVPLEKLPRLPSE